MIKKEEDKYFVINRSLIDNLICASPEFCKAFATVEFVLNDFLKFIEKERPKYIVCNQDEPYADKVWQAILDGESEKYSGKENIESLGIKCYKEDQAYGDFMSIAEFLENVDSRCFTDDDGYGELVIDNIVTDFVVIPSQIRRYNLDRFTEVAWYNK